MLAYRHIYRKLGFTMAWLYRQNNSQYWWIGYRINGRQYLRSTRETDRAEAEKLLAQFGTIQEANRAGRLTEEFYLALTQQERPGWDGLLRLQAGQWLDPAASFNREHRGEPDNVGQRQ